MSFNPDANSLSGSDDVALDSLANTQLLLYSSGIGKWVNATPEIAAINGLQGALDAKLALKNNVVALTSSSSDYFATVNISDDASPTSSWPDRLAFNFDGVRTGYFNEYGELRARSAKDSTVAFRAFPRWSAPDESIFFQLSRTDASDAVISVSKKYIDTLNATKRNIHTASPTDAFVERTELNYPLTTNNPDLDQVIVNGTKTSWRNEWGALRGTAPYSSGYGDALVRAIRTDQDVISNSQAFEIVDRRTGANGNVMWGRQWTDGALVRNGNTMGDVFVLENGATPPSNLPAGTVIIEKSA